MGNTACELLHGRRNPAGAFNMIILDHYRIIQARTDGSIRRRPEPHISQAAGGPASFCAYRQAATGRPSQRMQQMRSSSLQCRIAAALN